MQRPGINLVPWRGARHVLGVKGEGCSLPGAALSGGRLELESAQCNQSRLICSFFLYTLPAVIMLWHALSKQRNLLDCVTHVLDALSIPGQCMHKAYVLLVRHKHKLLSALRASLPWTQRGREIGPALQGTPAAAAARRAPPPQPRAALGQSSWPAGACLCGPA